jgi:hypothetical protein
MYRQEKEESGKKQVVRIVETKDGSLSRLLSINGLCLAKTLCVRRINDLEARVPARLSLSFPDVCAFNRSQKNP